LFLFLFFNSSAKSTSEIKDHNSFIEQVRELCLRADSAQIALEPSAFAEITRKFTESLQLTDSWIKGVLPLTLAVQKLTAQAPGIMTPVHVDFCQVCLKAKTIDAALRVLADPVFEVSKENGLTPLDYLRFNLYAGNIYCVARKWDKALEHYEMALLIETRALSAVQVVCYKKYVLTGLLVHGDLVELPEKLSASSHYVQRNCKRLAPSYLEVAKAYKNNNKPGSDSLTKVLMEHHEEFKKDKNWGIAKLLVKQQMKTTVQKLTSTYVTLSLADIVSRADLSSTKEAESLVVSMIESGSISAKIDQSKEMISFLEIPSSLDTTAHAELLDSKIKTIQQLHKQIKKKNKEIELNPAFLSLSLEGADKAGRFFDRGDDDMERALAESMSSHGSH